MSGVRAISRLAKTAAGPVLSLVFPPACRVGDEPVEEWEAGLSPKVREQLARGILVSYCVKCGATVNPHAARGKKGDCPRCINRQMGLTGMARVGLYDLPLSKLVTSLKFRKNWEIAAVLAPFLKQAIELCRAADALPLDALIPVPLHWRRGLLRGFNQSEELARHVGKLAGWPVRHALRRTRATFEQSHLQSALQRAENLRGAFRASGKKDVAGKHVWLIDDVCTTGATLRAARRALMTLPPESRPAGVYAAVICVTDKMDLAHFSE